MKKKYFPNSHNKERKEAMQNSWIPAAKIRQISSFYSRSWRDVDLL